MSFKILYVTATRTEAATLNKVSGIIPVAGIYRYDAMEIIPLVTGIGSVSTSWALKQWISINGKPDLAINSGIAGSYKDEYPIGDVLMPYTDCFADAGIEDGESFLTLTEAGLIKAEEYPYLEGFLYSDNRYRNKIGELLKQVRAITVNTSTGSEATKRKLVEKFNPDIETMEGATFFYICSMEDIPFLAMRAVSNMVERRNRNNWNIDLALDNLSAKLIEILLTL
jgi:futalosine hydrolase